MEVLFFCIGIFIWEIYVGVVEGGGMFVLLIPVQTFFYAFWILNGRSPNVGDVKNVIFNHNWREISLYLADLGKDCFEIRRIGRKEEIIFWKKRVWARKSS